GFYAGVGGGIAVNVITVNTNALIGNNARINQGEPGGVSPGSPDANQDVEVAATHVLDVVSAGGAAGIGLVGPAGAIDIGIVRDNTRAIVGNGAKLSAADDVAVEARNERRIRSYAISVGGGLVGLAGAVSVWSLGAEVQGDGLSSLNTSSGDDPN